MLANITNENSLYYEIIGSGPLDKDASPQAKAKPVLFLIHGGPGIDHSGFKMHSLQLAEVAQLVLFDLNGHGKSSGEPKDHTLEKAIKDVEELRQYLGLSKIGVLGFSYGGMVALGYAAHYSANLACLILMCTAASYHFIERSKLEFYKRRPTTEQAAVFDRLCEGALKDRCDFIEYFNQLGPLYSKEIKRQREKEGESTSSWDDAKLGVEASNAAYKANFWNYDFRPFLAKVSCPTLILGADDDWMCHAEFSKEIAELIPHAELHIFKDCGHILPIDRNKEYLDTVSFFF